MSLSATAMMMDPPSRAPSTYETLDNEFDYPIMDKTLNSLILFQFNFNDLKKVLDFLMANQKKQQHILNQIIDQRVEDGSLQIIEKIVHLPNRDEGVQAVGDISSR